MRARGNRWLGPGLANNRWRGEQCAMVPPETDWKSMMSSKMECAFQASIVMERAVFPELRTWHTLQRQSRSSISHEATRLYKTCSGAADCTCSEPQCFEWMVLLDNSGSIALDA